MRNKTDNAAEIGMHLFTRAGLGQAPFRCVGFRENRQVFPDGTSKAGGSCHYCFTGISTECVVESADGKQFVVGINCVEKTGDAGLIRGYKNNPAFRAHSRKLRQNKATRDRAEVADLLAKLAPSLSAQPHPHGFLDRATGKPLTMLDSWNWLVSRCGAAGMARNVRTLRQMAKAVAA